MTIQILAPDVAAKIAAGEVVERPATVVKELVENSLDAGATDVRVELREGGRRLLRVTDNGHGIPAEEVAVAFERHATSKLTSAEDLTHIGTFGFRGEALYSIAAVSRVTLTTRHQDEEFGTQVRVEGGEITAHSRSGSPVGTVVAVEHLFFNVPARRKFLRKAATEAGRVSSVIQHFALANPTCRFSFANEGRLLFQSNGSGDIFDVLVKIYGLENARQMVAVGPAARDTAAASLLAGSLDDDVVFMEETGQDAAVPPQADTIRVSGYVSLPTLTRANRSNINLFVNRRAIDDRSLTFAVTQAYHTLLPGGRFPIAAIFVDMDPSRVDVNVHPQKTQVRLVDERQVFSAVQKAVRRAVIEHAGIPQTGAGDDAPMGAGRPAAGNDPAGIAGEGNKVQGWSVRRDALLDAGRQQPDFDLYVPPAADAVPDASGGGTSDPAAPDETGARPGPSGSNDGQSVLDQRPRKLPPLRVVGQVGAMYIVTEGPEGVYLIDQHAAHERILYEKFMAERYGMPGGRVARQHLLEPLTLHAGTDVAGLVAQHLDALARVGFEVEEFGGDTYLVRAVPGVLAGEDPLRALEEIVQALADRRNLVGEELEARLVKMVCKRAAIKAGQQLSIIEMRELIRQLEACQSPRTCPHGRPTMIQLSAGELEKAFGRI